MAWPPERPAAHVGRDRVGRDHVGRHRHARLEAEELAGAAGTDGRGAGDRTVDGTGADQAPMPGGTRRPEGEEVEQVVDDPGGPRPEAKVAPLFSVPDSLRSVDVTVGGRAVRGLLLVAVVLLLTLGGRWWWVSQQAAGAPVEQVVGAGLQAGAGGTPAASEGGGVPGEGDGGPEGGTGAPAAAAATRPSAAPSDAVGVPGADGEDPSGGDGAHTEVVLVVHVIGEVHEPGVVQLPPGSRVVDAVRAVGGLTDDADPASLNMARPVVDGEQVWVGAPGEEPPPWLQTAPAAPGTGAGGGAGGAGAGRPGDDVGGGGGHGGLLVDLNLADQAQLEELPGVGPVTADSILAWRDQHGRFTAVEELMEVSGIGEKTFERLRPHVTVGG